MVAVRVSIGILVGFAPAAGFAFVGLHFLLQVHGPAASILPLVCGVIGGAYTGIATGRDVYGYGPLSILGYLLDMTWSLLNTTASMAVWLPACMIAGGNFVEPDDNSKRSGTFVYSENPRGGGYDATTVGTVIAGGWSSHEEVHVWQARLFGPLYLPAYLTSLLLNLLFRLCTGKLDNIVEQAYYRICFEDWAYSAGSSSGDSINPGMWVLWCLITLVYVALLVLVFIGAFAGSVAILLIAIGGLIVYNIIRVFTPTNA